MGKREQLSPMPLYNRLFSQHAANPTCIPRTGKTSANRVYFNSGCTCNPSRLNMRARVLILAYLSMRRVRSQRQPCYNSFYRFSRYAHSRPRRYAQDINNMLVVHHLESRGPTTKFRDRTGGAARLAVTPILDTKMRIDPRPNLEAVLEK